MQMKPAATFAELMHDEEFDSAMHFALNPGNHAFEKMLHEIGERLSLLHWKTASPRKVLRPKGQRQEPKPATRESASPQVIDEFTNAIGKAEPTSTGRSVFPTT